MRFIFLLFLTAFLSLDSLWAEVPVTPHPNQKELLLSEDPQLEANKRLVYDFFRVILVAWQVDQVDRYLSDEYIQHNPNVKTGKKGFLDFLNKISQGKTKPLPNELRGLVSIQAEKDLVTFAFVRHLKDSDGVPYTTTWFDMFRVANGIIVEHWDGATKP